MRKWVGESTTHGKRVSFPYRAGGNMVFNARIIDAAASPFDNVRIIDYSGSYPNPTLNMRVTD